MIQVPEKFSLTYIDPSGLSCFSRCPLKFMFERLMGLRSPQANRMALDYGTDFHFTVPHCYGPRASLGERTEKAKAVFSDHWLRRPYEALHDKKRDLAHAQASITHFARTHCTEDCPYSILHFDSISNPDATCISDNEVAFAVDIGAALPFLGRIDALVEWNNTHELWPLDYKTTGELSPRLFTNFMNCPQALGYTLASSLLTGREAKGLIVEAIRVGATVENTATPIAVRPHQLERFVSWAKEKVEQMLDYNESQRWPSNPAGCAPYSSYGSPGYICQFIDICHNPDWNFATRFFERSKPFHPFDISDEVPSD